MTAPNQSQPGTQSLWQPIETAPKDGTAILATGGGLDDSVQIISYLEHVGAWETSEVTLDDRDDEADGYSRPTHWQPLPTPPRSSTDTERARR